MDVLKITHDKDIVKEPTGGSLMDLQVEADLHYKLCTNTLICTNNVCFLHSQIRKMENMCRKVHSECTVCALFSIAL